MNEMPSQCHERSMKSPVSRPRSEWCDACCLHIPVERLMPGPECLVVAAITRFIRIEDRDNKAWHCTTTNAAGRLNVFGNSFGLSVHHHDAKAFNIDTDRDHVRC